MTIQAGIDLNIEFSILDPDAHAPCSTLAPFTVGSLTDYDTVLRFGLQCEHLTIEIENVNADALSELEKQGVKVFPQPNVVKLIQDKGLQKEFYKRHQLPTAAYKLMTNREDVLTTGFFPAVNKLRREGYDGRGVVVLKDKAEAVNAFDAPSVLEELVPIDKEIAVLVARDEKGNCVTYPPVEMVFHGAQNLVDLLLSPARLTGRQAQEAASLARTVAEELEIVGLLAVEMFLTQEGNLLINEIAPRPHNSGHHTIEGNVTSQFEQHLRAILGFPLGSTEVRSTAVMVNLLGAPGFSGTAVYQGLKEVLSLPDVYVHLYGKKVTKPFRKMGHVTILGSEVESLLDKANFVKKTIQIISN